MFPIGPSSAVVIAFLAVFYVLAARRLNRRPTQRQAFFFCLFIIVMLLTFGPLDGLADRRACWARLLEHSLQGFVIPPLFLLAMPEWMLRPFVMSRHIEPLAQFVTRPLVAFISFAVVFVLAHDPPVFDLMCRNTDFQILVHLIFLIAGTILWFPLLSPLPEFPRLSYPMQIFYLFLLMVPMTAVAAPITLSSSVIYPWYLAGSHPLGVSPMEDQVIGGIVMWVGIAFFLIMTATLIFFRWARDDEIEVPPINLRRGPDLRVLPRSHDVQT